MLILLVSHLQKFAENTKEYFLTMIPKASTIKIEAIGGTHDGQIGTDHLLIENSINKYADKDVLIICDLGSAIMSSKIAKMNLNDKNIHISRGTFVEGGFFATTLSSSGASFQTIIKAAEEMMFKY